jgi:hypothetical protein
VPERQPNYERQTPIFQSDRNLREAQYGISMTRTSSAPVTVTLLKQAAADASNALRDTR